ncbi:MAG: cysteine desulfurase [Lachnospiraceae bacterium]|nr:cysteine desulfurase [Lachnospiraceae bacterium]
MTDQELKDNVIKYRKLFPLLSQDIAYLDNAATTQKPVAVLDAMKAYYEEDNANPFRGVYDLSERATERYEEARAKTAAFINASTPEEIVFVRNATEALNLLAYSWCEDNISEGDEIVVSVMEHHSDFLPWKYMAEKKNAKLVKLEPDETGAVTDEALDKCLSDKTKLVAITQVSNVLGRVNDIKHIAEKVHAAGALISVDGAQSVPHMKVDVRDMDADFLSFSGHKMYGPMGIGALYAKKKHLEKLRPFMYGGEMIATVHWDRVTYAEIPHKFEAGTVNVGGAVGLSAAIDFINEVGWDIMEKQEEKLTLKAVNGIKEINGIRLIGSDRPEDHKGIVTFMVDDVHPHDVADIMGRAGVCVRAGHHCAQPLMDHLGVKSTCRASFAFYNTEEEVDKFLTELSKVRGLMGYGF